MPHCCSNHVNYVESQDDEHVEYVNWLRVGMLKYVQIPRTPWIAVVASVHIRFYFLVFLFILFIFFISCGRLRQLMSAFECMLK